MHWLSDFLGLSGTGPVYAFWSGFGSDLGEVTLLGGVIVYLRHHNCHEKGCWRLGHPHEGVVQCRRHLPKNHGA